MVVSSYKGEAMTNLTWTTEKPTQPGWYWWRVTKDDRERRIVHVWFSDRIDPTMPRLIVDGVGDRYDLADCQWAGPLLPPEEPPT